MFYAIRYASPHLQEDVEIQLHSLLQRLVGVSNTDIIFHSPKSNKEKEKTTKNFLMVSRSKKVTRKQTLSVRQQQMRLKKHINGLEKKQKLVQKLHNKRRKAKG